MVILPIDIHLTWYIYILYTHTYRATPERKQLLKKKKKWRKKKLFYYVLLYRMKDYVNELLICLYHADFHTYGIVREAKISVNQLVFALGILAKPYACLTLIRSAEWHPPPPHPHPHTLPEAKKRKRRGGGCITTITLWLIGFTPGLCESYVSDTTIC